MSVLCLQICILVCLQIRQLKIQLASHNLLLAFVVHFKDSEVTLNGYGL